MKKVALIFVSITLFSFSNCKPKVDNSVKDSGTAIVLNGKGETDTVPYICGGCKEYLDKSSFNKIVTISTEETKKLMNFPRTFIPLKMRISIVKEDSIFHYDTNERFEGVFRVITNYYYAAKNAYGTETEGDTYVSFYTDTLGNVSRIENFIKLPTLNFNGDGVNRNLILYGDDGDYIKIDVNKKSLLVTSSVSCIDRGTWLTFYLDNDEKFHLTSWNDFNCDGYSFFYWFDKSQIYLLKTHKVKFISITDKKSAFCPVPDNEQEYFLQLVNLYEK